MVKTKLMFMSNQTIDSEASDVNNANANHISATTALKTHDTEMQKILCNCEEVSETIIQYMPTSTLQSAPHLSAKT